MQVGPHQVGREKGAAPAQCLIIERPLIAQQHDFAAGAGRVEVARQRGVRPVGDGAITQNDGGAHGRDGRERLLTAARLTDDMHRRALAQPWP